MIRRRTYKFSRDLRDQFESEILDKMKIVDPTYTENWFSLTYGWAIGKGLDLEKAYEFAMYCE